MLGSPILSSACWALGRSCCSAWKLLCSVPRDVGGGGLPASRGRTSRAGQGGAAGGGLRPASPYLPSSGRVAPMVTENKEMGLGGGAWVSWSRF